MPQLLVGVEDKQAYHQHRGQQPESERELFPMPKRQKCCWIESDRASQEFLALPHMVLCFDILWQFLRGCLGLQPVRLPGRGSLRYQCVRKRSTDLRTAWSQGIWDSATFPLCASHCSMSLSGLDDILCEGARQLSLSISKRHRGHLLYNLFNFGYG